MLPTPPYTPPPPAWGAPLLPGGQRGRGPLTSSLGRSPEIRTEAEIFDTGVKLEGNLEQRFAEEETTAGKMAADRPAAEEAAAAKAAAKVWGWRRKKSPVEKAASEKAAAEKAAAEKAAAEKAAAEKAAAEEAGRTWIPPEDDDSDAQLCPESL